MNISAGDGMMKNEISRITRRNITHDEFLTMLLHARWRIYGNLPRNDQKPGQAKWNLSEQKGSAQLCVKSLEESWKKISPKIKLL
jgi:uncharacterized protein YbdZ (MbtH family)